GPRVGVAETFPVFRRGDKILRRTAEGKEMSPVDKLARSRFRCYHIRPTRQGDRSSSPWRFSLRVGASMAIAAYLLFCHGCHGDEDNELFANTGQSLVWLNR